MINFFRELLRTYNDGLRLRTVLEEQAIKDYHHKKQVSMMIEAYSRAVHDKYLLRNKIKELLKDKKIDVQELKPYYEKKYGVRPWLYDPYGTGEKVDVRNVLKLSQKESGTIISAAKKIIKAHHLSENTHPSVIVESVIKYFIPINRWKYTSDKKQFGKPEYWERPDNSWKTKEGDCDDLAILMHVIIKNIFWILGLQEHYWRLKLAAAKTLLGGHAFNIWLGDDGEWYVVESTLDLKGSYRKTWLKTPVKNNNLYEYFFGFARSDRSWAGSSSSLDPVKKEIGDTEK